MKSKTEGKYMTTFDLIEELKNFHGNTNVKMEIAFGCGCGLTRVTIDKVIFVEGECILTGEE